MAAKIDIPRLFAPTPEMAERVKAYRIEQGLISEGEAVRRLSRIGLQVLAPGLLEAGDAEGSAP